jgi:hypothetical protein
VIQGSHAQLPEFTGFIYQTKEVPLYAPDIVQVYCLADFDNDNRQLGLDPVLGKWSNIGELYQPRNQCQLFSFSA